MREIGWAVLHVDGEVLDLFKDISSAKRAAAGCAAYRVVPLYARADGGAGELERAAKCCDERAMFHDAANVGDEANDSPILKRKTYEWGQEARECAAAIRALPRASAETSDEGGALPSVEEVAKCLYDAYFNGKGAGLDTYCERASAPWLRAARAVLARVAAAKKGAS